MTDALARDPTDSIRPRKLFIASCVALVATSVAFATIGAVMGTLKSEFVLTNQQVGWIGGAALWGFAVAQLLFAPFCDTLGMRWLLRLAFVCHVAGAMVMIFATGFGMLFTGALTLALGNGLVEAACNPLVAALYPGDKTVKLNQFHVWFPGGVVIGALAAFGLDGIGIGAWQLKVGLILVPTLAYGVLMLREEFPPTEGVSAGVSMSEMFRATFTTPLMLVMLACMAITASTELGPNRWVPAVLESGGIPGILVLAWINGLMALLRYRAGFAVHRLSPTGVLLASAAISFVGLLWLSYADTITLAFAAATVFAVGVCYFWPTMLGFVSERIPKSGALGLGLMGAVGMATVGLVTAPLMGRIADEVGHDRLPAVETMLLFDDAVTTLEARVATAPEERRSDIRAAASLVETVMIEATAEGELPEIDTANALRAIIDSGAGDELAGRAQAILGPADNYGGRISFRYILPFTGALILVFGGLYLRDRRAGGYRVERIRGIGMTPPRLRYGMIGGGPGAFIGAVHWMAAALDGEIELVAGAFSSDGELSRRHGRALRLGRDRVYGSYRDMIEREASLPRDERLDFFSIVTPNHLHFDPARRCLEAGFHVVCDKPLTTTVKEAETLCRLAEEHDRIFAVTYNYTGYPMVREARERVRAGEIGTIRRVEADYIQGWLATPLEETGQRQAAWRTDPELAGVAGALGDIGTHAHNLAAYVTGLEIEEILAELTTFVEGRRLDDDATVLVRYAGGAKGRITASQIATGEENGLSLRVYGTEGSLVWRQEEPETLILRALEGPARILRRGGPSLSEAAEGAARLPAGHPEGFIEGFANLYAEVARAIRARAEDRAGARGERAGTERGAGTGSPAPGFSADFPTVRDGAAGVHFIHRAVESARLGAWLDARYDPPGAPAAARSGAAGPGGADPGTARSGTSGTGAGGAGGGP